MTDPEHLLTPKKATETLTFGTFRKTALTRISETTLPPGTVYATPEGLRAEDEETRCAVDVQGGIYPIRESVFQASYGPALSPDASRTDSSAALRAAGPGQALALALADNGYVDPHHDEQYQLVDALPILAALASRGYEVRAALAEAPVTPAGERPLLTPEALAAVGKVSFDPTTNQTMIKSRLAHGGADYEAFLMRLSPFVMVEDSVREAYAGSRLAESSTSLVTPAGDRPLDVFAELRDWARSHAALKAGAGNVDDVLAFLDAEERLDVRKLARALVEVEQQVGLGPGQLVRHSDSLHDTATAIAREYAALSQNGEPSREAPER